MEKFITINGASAWITERKSLEKATESAQNICDLSKEVIVREITELTDYTKIYENQPIYYSQMQSIINKVVEQYGDDPIISKFGKSFVNELKKLEGF